MIRQPDYDRAATQACRCLLQLRIASLPVRPLDILRKCRNTVIYTYHQAAEQMNLTPDEFERRCGQADAFTIRQGNRYIVCYRDGGNPARMNFTLAHELGHILLRHEEDQTAEEAEANCFAGQLLCPEPVVGKLTADDLSTTCFVSRSAAQMVKKAPRGQIPEQLSDKLKQQMAN